MAEKADRIGEFCSEEDLREELSAPAVDLATASIGAWAGAQLVSYAVVTPRPAADPVHAPSLESLTDPGFPRGGRPPHRMGPSRGPSCP
ncbi:hypothetical protein [Amycolatopsis sulphurea]|uniref:hypothetical protein n=1 Tax=Amycolatopsis sulphurea TaxID=76022 RepID=UPI001FE52540|nr:hypothetical protein [Amycolatopsis sulphurea]